jgi:hypothetical protein
MRKLRQSICSILMMLAIGTVSAQTPATELVYPKPQHMQEFGTAVSVYDQYTVAASEYENDVYFNGNTNTYFGTVRLFKNNQFVRRYTYGNGDNLGLGKRHAVAIGQHAIVAGVIYRYQHYVQAGGVLLAHRLSNGDYESSFTLTLVHDPIDNYTNLNFGAAVAIEGDWLAVGATGRLNTAGGVYMFQRTGDKKWSKRGWISTPALQTGDRFGKCIKISGDQMIVTGGSSIYIYKLQNNVTWTLVYQYTSPMFGFSDVDITNNHAVGGRDGEPALVFKKTGNDVWSLSQTITGTQRFGLNVAISNQNLVISNDLKIFYYQLQNNFTLIGSMYIPPYNAATGRIDKVRVGFDVDIHNDRIIASAVNTNYLSGPNQGAVFTDFFYNGFANPNHLREESFETETASQFSIYPNPSVSNVSLDCEGVVLKVTATNSEGVNIPVEFSGNTLLVEDFKAGLYFLNVETSTGSYKTKFVKQ